MAPITYVNITPRPDLRAFRSSKKRLSPMVGRRHEPISLIMVKTEDKAEPRGVTNPLIRLRRLAIHKRPELHPRLGLNHQQDRRLAINRFMVPLCLILILRGSIQQFKLLKVTEPVFLQHFKNRLILLLELEDFGGECLLFY